MSINVNQTKENVPCCPMHEVDVTDTRNLEQNDRFCIRIAKMMEDPESRFIKRNSYGYDTTVLLCHVNKKNGKECKATIAPKVLIKIPLQEMHDHFGTFGIRKTYSLIKRYYYWPKMIKHIQAHVNGCSLCRREKIQADKYQLQTTEIPNRAFAKVSIDLIVEIPTSHNVNKKISVMVDHLTSWPMVKDIPDKEATTVANAIFDKLILEHGTLEILFVDNEKEFSNDTLAYVFQEFGIKQHFTSPHTPRPNGKTEDFNKFLKVLIRKLCQENKASWDQVLAQTLFSYRYCPHTTSGEALYILVYNRDLPIPLHRLIKVVDPYMGENTLRRRIEPSRVALSIEAKMLEKMRENQKKYYQNGISTHTFKIGDLVLLKKYNVDKMQLKWEPNYRIVKCSSAWSAVVENQLIGKSKRCNIGDLKLNSPVKIGNLSPAPFGELPN